jgi:shikimate dehydrogenase
MPLKHVALRCVDEVSELARAVSAANTILLDHGGHRRADNTDAPGMVNALREAGAGLPEEAAVLGGGATARSAIASLSELTDRVVVYVRTPSRAAPLRATADAQGVALEIRPWSDREHALAAPLVIATTPAGVIDDLTAAVPARPGLLLDVVYAPWPTSLARAWQVAGGDVVGGFDFLVHQARLQVRLFTGYDIPVAVLRNAGAWAIESRAGDAAS